MLEIGTSGSVRGVDALCMAEYCDTPRSKEGSNREYKECLSIRAIVHLLDGFCESKLAFFGSQCQCAAASDVRDGSRPPVTGLQEQVTNHRKRLWLRALVVSVTEKVL
jgi:hypothetical protein